MCSFLTMFPNLLQLVSTLFEQSKPATYYKNPADNIESHRCKPIFCK